MTPHTLTIEFHGVCTHFRGVVPGVPHRVVLPDAAVEYTGMLQIGAGDPYFYLLMPHVGRVMLHRVPVEEQLRLTIHDVMLAGFFLEGVRLQIMNSIDREILYDPTYDNIPQLTKFVPDFNYSADVVLGGRASAYFDIFGGTVSAEQISEGDAAMKTVVTITTDGYPQLMVTPFVASQQADELASGETLPEAVPQFELRTDRIVVGNFDLYPGVDACDDYLWHYAAMHGGLPRKLLGSLPGMDQCTRPVDPDLLAAARMERDRVMHDLRRGILPPLRDSATLASCSDSRYP